MSTTTAPMTVEAYFAVSVEGDRTQQLIGGELVVNQPLPMHGAIQVRLTVALGVWSKAEEGRGLVLPPVDVVIGEHDVYGPDVIWIAEQHRPADLRRRLPRVPELCVEIRSPGTWRYDVGRKKAVYETGGVPEVWLVDDVAQTVLVFRRSASDEQSFDVALELSGADTLASPQLPGFSLALGTLFES